MVNRFSNLEPDLWTVLASIQTPRVYEEDCVLFEQEQPPQGLFMIQKGKVQIWITSSSGVQRVMATVGPGTMLGLSESVAGDPHKLSARSVGRVELSFVPRDLLMRFLSEHHEFCLQVVRALSEDLHALYQQVRGLSSSPSRPRPRGFDEPVQ